MTTLRPISAGDQGSLAFEQPGLDTATHGQARARREGSEFDELAFHHLEQPNTPTSGVTAARRRAARR